VCVPSATASSTALTVIVCGVWSVKLSTRELKKFVPSVLTSSCALAVTVISTAPAGTVANAIVYVSVSPASLTDVLSPLSVIVTPATSSSVIVTPCVVCAPNASGACGLDSVSVSVSLPSTDVSARIGTFTVCVAPLPLPAAKVNVVATGV